jgi:hypothetical protein
LPGGAGRISWLREEGYGPNARDEHHNGDRDCRDHDANGELYLDQPISDRYSQLWGARHNGQNPALVGSGAHGSGAEWAGSEVAIAD